MADPHLRSFLGRIARLPSRALRAAAGGPGLREVWFPRTEREVASAVALAPNPAAAVRSGTQADAATDRADAPGGVVINLAGLNRIEVQPGRVRVEAAATTAALADALAGHGLALPIGSNPRQSLAAGLIHEGPSCLSRTLGPLSDYVAGVTVATPDGRLSTETGAAALPALRAPGVVVTAVELTPAPDADLWMFSKVLPYPGRDAFEALCRSLLRDQAIPARADLAIDAVSSRFDLPVVRIIAAGASADDEAAVRDHVDRALAGMPGGRPDKVLTERYVGGAVLPAVARAGFSVPIDPRVDAYRLHRVLDAGSDPVAFLGSVADDVDRGVAYRDDQSGLRDEDLRPFVRLQRDRADRLELSGLLFVTQHARPTFPADLGALAPSPRPAAPPSGAPESLPGADREASDARIAGFKGEVYAPSDWWFRRHAAQYATSSYPADRMTPHLIAYPVDADDIGAAIRHAKAAGKHLVARSGGHQYSGLSSGGDETIVLAMDAFDHVRPVSDHVFDVGPSVPLTDLAAEFRDRSVTIPHGECPLVNIGGHAQTGGFGHLRRGFGLMLDHVIALTIVLADGSVKTLQRPDGPPTTPDEELFWGVLGGNAGSFGIVTNYRVECIKDGDHPHSYAFKGLRWYEKTRFRALMNEVQRCTREAEAGTLPPDVNFSMLVESASGLVPAPILVVELLHMNLGGPGEEVDGEEVFRTIIEAADSGPPSLLDLATIRGPRRLSAYSDSVVRRYPLTTLDGREFRHPYRKRTNCTSKALTDAFVERFVALVDRVVEETDGVYLLFQMMIGGGNFRTTPRRAETSIPRRDFVYGFSFYLFYEPGFEAEADRLQQELGRIVAEDFNQGPEQRLFWSTFGDTDLSKPEVRDLYYDSIEVYERLQALKRRVDPDDVFHSSMTVKRP